MKYDLLNLVEQGGCSAKLSASELQKALDGLPKIKNKNLLVDIETHDDAGVFKINDDYAIIQTTDFFPPVCSDAYDFGQIAAANALSDVYAMGGQVLTALNIVLFPAKLPMEILKEILRGGHDKVIESGGVIVGGHTIADDIPKYGLAVSGWIHPDNIITNSDAKPGDILLLTKPLGTGVAIAAKKVELGEIETYNEAIETMKQLNMHASDIMIKHKVKCATDITGFGLLGHALKLAQASEVSIKIDSQQVPALNKTFELIEMGCIPGAAFRNLEFVEDECLFENSVEYNSKMLLVDAQTSGGLLICSPPEAVETMKKELIAKGYEQTAIVGKVIDKDDKSVFIS
jgi:selenide, water dikinase